MRPLGPSFWADSKKSQGVWQYPCLHAKEERSAELSEYSSETRELPGDDALVNISNWYTVTGNGNTFNYGAILK